MNKIPARGNENPGFIPAQDFYITLPAIYTSAGNNSFALSDLMQSVDGSVQTPFDKNTSTQSFLHVLEPITKLHSEASLNILGFGFKHDKNFFSFGLSEKVTSSASIPKDMFRLLLEGVPLNSSTQNYNLSSLAIDADAYMEMALGYALQLTPRLSVGGKLKFLLGQFNTKIEFSSLNLSGNASQTTITGTGSMLLSVPGKLYADQAGYPNFAGMRGDDFGPTKFKGSGLGLDVGATYKLTDKLTVSGAITDFGYIHWRKSDWEGKQMASKNFNNMDYNVKGNTDFGQVLDSLKTTMNFRPNSNGYSSSLTTHIKMGAEYSVLKDKIGLGLLFDERIASAASTGSLTASANFRPLSWLNASIAYSFINNEASNIGAGLNIIAGSFNFYMITDYLPLSYANGGIPKTKQFNFQTGLGFTFGTPKKKMHNIDKKALLPPPAKTEIEQVSN